MRRWRRGLYDSESVTALACAPRLAYRTPFYHNALRQHSVTQSMSRKGNCLDNAVMESFFATLKSEFYHLTRFRDLDDLATGLQQYTTTTTMIASN